MFFAIENVYFFMGLPFHGRALAIDPHIPREDRVETMVARNCVGPNPMLSSIICIEAIDEFLTKFITSMVVRIYRFLGTQWITSGQLRVVEEVLDGDLFAWGVLMHTKVMSQLNWCWCADSSEFSFKSVMVVLFLERVPLLHLRILLKPTLLREPRLMRWEHVLAHHGGGEGDHYFTTMVTLVWLQMPHVIIRYSYAGMGYKQDPDMVLPTGEDWDQRGMCCIFFCDFGR
jgi:hypothetical protein